jgi:hypothetical protein
MGDYVEYIPYIPNRVNYDTQQAISKEIISGACLPEGFPARLSSEMVWDSDSIGLDERGFVDDERCILKLNSDNLKEIHEALQYFKSKTTIQGYTAEELNSGQLSANLSCHSIQLPSHFHLSTPSSELCQKTYTKKRDSLWCAGFLWMNILAKRMSSSMLACHLT